MARALGEVVLLMVAVVVVVVMGGGGGGGVVEGANWCVIRSNASDQALQTALDYACGSGADCAPIQSTGLCYLPNTIQAHASYAFNSYYQRKSMAPGSCDFSGTATVAMTDPSYGSCVYPSSTSTAGGSTPPTTPTPATPITNNPSSPLTPTTTTPTSGGLTPGLGPTVPNTDSSESWLSPSITILFPFSFIIVLPLLFQTI